MFTCPLTGSGRTWKKKEEIITSDDEPRGKYRYEPLIINTKDYHKCYESSLFINFIFT